NRNDENGDERPTAEEGSSLRHALDGFEPDGRVETEKRAANLEDEEVVFQRGRDQFEAIAERPQRVENQGERKRGGGGRAKASADEQEHRPFEDAGGEKSGDLPRHGRDELNAG